MHPNIELTFDYSKEKVNFLDLEISIIKDKIVTSIFRKPTDKHLILHFESQHPFHVKSNIIYAQTLRYKRNISSPHTLKKELAFLKMIFLARNYPRKLIEKEMGRALHIPRERLLETKIQKPFEKRIVLRIPTFNAEKDLQTKMIKSNWLKTGIPNKLTITPINNPSIGDKLVRTKTKL